MTDLVVSDYQVQEAIRVPPPTAGGLRSAAGTKRHLGDHVL